MYNRLLNLFLELIILKVKEVSNLKLWQMSKGTIYKDSKSGRYVQVDDSNNLWVSGDMETWSHVITDLETVDRINMH